MRVAALYDIHGNLPALEAVLAEVERENVDAIVCGGDVVWGPMPAECLDRLAELDVLYLRGNADRDALEGDDPVDRYARARLSEEQKERVAAWPLTVELDVKDVGAVVFCHATPRDDHEIVTLLTPDEAVENALSGASADVVVCGHTHVQYDRRLPGGKRLLNAGSIGMPYEDDPDARWLLFAPQPEFRRTSYAVEEAIAAIERTGMPQVERIVANALRGEVSPDEAIRFFESQRAA